MIKGEERKDKEARDARGANAAAAAASEIFATRGRCRRPLSPTEGDNRKKRCSRPVLSSRLKFPPGMHEEEDEPTRGERRRNVEALDAAAIDIPRGSLRECGISSRISNL